MPASMPPRSCPRSPRLPAAVVVIAVILGACGASTSPLASTAASPGSSGGTASPAASTGAIPTVLATTASLACPAAPIVDAALGVTVAPPVNVTGGSPSATFPPGALVIVCEYVGVGEGQNVVIGLLDNMPASTIDTYSNRFPVPFSAVPGLGDDARAWRQTLSSGVTNEGVVAVSGSNLVNITATGTPATLAQVEALVRSLL